MNAPFLRHAEMWMNSFLGSVAPQTRVHEGFEGENVLNIISWVVVSTIFDFHPYFGKI